MGKEKRREEKRRKEKRKERKGEKRNRVYSPDHDTSDLDNLPSTQMREAATSTAVTWQARVGSSTLDSSARAFDATPRRSLRRADVCRVLSHSLAIIRTSTCSEQGQDRVAEWARDRPLPRID